MGTIASVLALKDKFAKTISRGTQGIDRMISSMERLDAKSIKLNTQKAFSAVRTQIEASKTELEKFIQQQDKAAQGAKKAESAWGGVKGMIAGAADSFTFKMGMEQTDLSANNQARLGFINDGMQTQAQLQQKIYRAAQRSRSEYNAMADSVSKLGMLAGGAFSSNNEMIAFAEQLNKAFAISGTAAESRSAAMLQLTQAMAAGQMQSDGYLSLLEDAPMVIDAIAKYTGKTKDELKELSSQGYITADMMKNSLFAASEEMDAKFQKMPKTFGSVWTQITNFAVMKFEPLMQRVNGLLNSSTGAAVISAMTSGISFLAAAVTGVLDFIQTAGGFAVRNWGVIQPILLGVTAAFLYWGATLLPGLAASLWGMLPPIAAQAGLWMLANYPIVLAGLAVAGLALLLNHFGITADQVVGYVTGLFYGLGAAVWNVAAHIVNRFVFAAEFIGNVFQHPLYSAKRLFFNFADSVLDILTDLAQAIDFVFGSSLAGTVADWQAGLTDWLGEAPEGYEVLEKMEHLNLMDFGKKGYTAGADFANGIKSGASGLFGGIFAKDDPFGIGNTGGFGAFGGGSTKTPDIGRVGEVGKISGSVNIADEDLQLMKDIAEMRYVQNFVTLTPTVAMNAQVSERVDIDELTGRVADVLLEEVAAGAEGVY